MIALHNETRLLSIRQYNFPVYYPGVRRYEDMVNTTAYMVLP